MNRALEAVDALHGELTREGDAAGLGGRREAVDAEMPVLRVSGKARARKIRPVRRVGPDLRFETEAARLPIEPPAE